MGSRRGDRLENSVGIDLWSAGAAACVVAVLSGCSIALIYSLLLNFGPNVFAPVIKINQ
jgi:hypothetical protein